MLRVQEARGGELVSVAQMVVPEAMLSVSARAWPAGGEWVLQPKWDGYRLLVAVDEHRRLRAWSRHGTSLTAHLDALLAPLERLPAGTILDGELVAIGESDGQPVQDFGAVGRAVFAAQPASAARLRYIAFDLLALDGEDLRDRPWRERDSGLRDALPTDPRIRAIATLPAAEVAHAQLIALGFEGSVLKRVKSAYRPGRSRAWLKQKARHELTGRLERVYTDHDGQHHAVCDVEGRAVRALAGADTHRLIGQEVTIAHSRIDADGTPREARIGSRPPEDADA